MTTENYYFNVVDSAGDRQPVAGLTPSWVYFMAAATDGAGITPQPSFFEVGNGRYGFSYDVDVHGEALGRIDAGSSLVFAGDRFLTGSCLRSAELRPEDIQALEDAILDQTNGIEVGTTVRQAIRLLIAASAGTRSGIGTGTVTIKGVGVDTTRMTAAVDSVGNVSAVTVNR